MIDNFEPPLVCGAPRSGTRFVAAALNQQSTISLQGEVPAPTMQLTPEYIRSVDSYHNGRAERWGGAWSGQRRAMIYFAWSSLQKGRLRNIKDGRVWFGNKTPGHEIFWRDYEDVPGVGRVRCVFCIRNLRDHYLSMRAMNERSTIDKVAKRYRAAHRNFCEMKTGLGPQVSLFILDDLKTGGAGYLCKTLFEDLGIPFEPENALDPGMRTNTSENFGRDKRKVLNTEELPFMHDNSDIDEIINSMRALAASSPAPSPHQD